MEQNNMNTGEGSTGPIIGTIIILAIVVLGGLYFWGQRTTAPTIDIYGNPVSSSTTPATVDTTTIDTQSSSDNPASIQNDLKSTNTNNLGSQINAS